MEVRTYLDFDGTASHTSQFVQTKFPFAANFRGDSIYPELHRREGHVGMRQFYNLFNKGQTLDPKVLRETHGKDTVILTAGIESIQREKIRRAGLRFPVISVEHAANKVQAIINDLKMMTQQGFTLPGRIEIFDDHSEYFPKQGIEKIQNLVQRDEHLFR